MAWIFASHSLSNSSGLGLHPPTYNAAAALGLGLPLASTLFKRRVDHAYLQARRATGQYQRVLSLL